MRVLYVTGHYPPDFVSGATLQVQRLARAVAAGHEVTVLAGAFRSGIGSDATAHDRDGDVQVSWLGTDGRLELDADANWRNEAAVAAMAELVAAWRPDVVHAHALQTLGAALLRPAMDAGVPVVVTMHDFWWWCPRLFLVDRDMRPCPLVTTTSECACARTTAWRRSRAEELGAILADVDVVLAPSAVMRDAVVANGAPPERTEIDENDVADSVIGEAAPRARHNGKAVLRFTYVGGDHPLKGRDVLLGAVEQLADVDGWTLTTYGVTPPPRPRWRPRRRAPRVTYRPAYEPTDTAAVMAATDVLIIPSVARESYSLAAREALAAGAVVITSDCLGPTEVVVDDVNGRVVPVGDPDALAAAMADLVVDRSRLARLRGHVADRPVRIRRTTEHAAALVDRYQRLRRSSSGQSSVQSPR